MQTVVALAPWVYPQDGDVDASGVDALIVHGTADRIASPARSLVVSTALRRSAKSVRYVHVDDGKHSMTDSPPDRAVRIIDGLGPETTR